MMWQRIGRGRVGLYWMSDWKRQGIQLLNQNSKSMLFVCWCMSQVDWTFQIRGFSRCDSQGDLGFRTQTDELMRVLYEPYGMR